MSNRPLPQGSGVAWILSLAALRRRAGGLHTTIAVLALCLLSSPTSAQSPATIPLDPGAAVATEPVAPPPTEAPPPASAPADAKPREPLARYAPDSAGIFLTLQAAREVDRVLEDSDAGALMELLSSGTLSTRRDVNQWLDGLLAGKYPVGAADLADLEIGLAARSWKDFEHAVWYIRLTDPTVVDRWFPRDTRSPDHDLGDVHFFTTRDGVVAAVRDGVLAMGRQSMPGALLGETLDVMADVEARPLTDSAAYRRLTADLPPGSIAAAYVLADPAAEHGGWTGRLVSSLADAVLMAAYPNGRRVEVVVRTVGGAADNDLPLSADAMEQLQQLPHNTLLAWAASVDLQSMFDRTVNRADRPWLSSHLALLSGLLASPERREQGLLRGIGPSVLLAWGGSPGRTPGDGLHVAALVECEDARGVASEMEAGLRRLMEGAAPAAEGEAPGPSPVRASTFLGARLVQVPLRELAGRLRLNLPEALDIEPAFAVSGRWLIVATTTQQVREILSARNGKLATLGRVSDVRQACRNSRSCGSVWVMQPKLSAGLIGRWLTAYDRGEPSVADADRWRPAPRSNQASVRWYGIGMRAEQSPGVVHVAVVHPNTAAADRLQPGDLIVGVDGELLRLESPNADLKSRLLRRGSGAGPVLRVLRGGETIDIALELPAAEVGQRPQLDLAGALGELTTLLRPVRLVTCSVETPQEGVSSARLTFRFDRPPPALADRGDRTERDKSASP
jgi:hypothetical protein